MSPQYLRRGESCRAATDNNDPLVGRTSRPRRRLFLFALHDNRAVTFLNPPACQRTERGRRNRFTRLQVETRVMPRTADCFANEEAIGERPVVVGAMG